jgi:hypothetical protein
MEDAASTSSHPRVGQPFEETDTAGAVFCEFSVKKKTRPVNPRETAKSGHGVDSG